MVAKHLKRNVGYALAGVVLGGFGIGWHGKPSDQVIVAAIRARSTDYAQAAITLVDVNRNWLHEVFDTGTSRFLVTAIVTPPDESGVERCFGVEPGLVGTALALGPYADWRCDYPF